QSSATLGKSAGKDLDANKPTYVTVLGLDEARRQAQALHGQALAALSRSGLRHTDHLRLLADMVVDRHS
ncbi:MAG TPA: polyprenyl synthetase family protein, partial [Aquabacterium sp.]|nr:polyprenyl synthetase family protein [Aquabacterium sp.]